MSGRTLSDPRLAGLAEPMPAIQVDNLTKTYGRGETAFQALKGVSLRIEQGELVMLVGPSGSGKTTLLSILGCVLTATSGSVHMFGESVVAKKDSELARYRLAYIGFVFQGHNLLAALTAGENIALLLELRGYSATDARSQARELLAAVGMEEKFDAHPADLSGGQRQRVAIARALAGSPPLILADEPTASLDAENGLRITELLRSLAKERGHTVLIVTHDNRIFHLADRIIHIEDGLLIEEPKAP